MAVARYCKPCSKMVWLASPSDDCPECGSHSRDGGFTHGVGIQCVWWDRVNEKDRTIPTGFHRGVNDYISSKRDLLNKAARKGYKVEFS